MTGKCVSFVLILSLVTFIETKETVIVKTSLGEVEGVKVTSIIENESYYSFKGIPYAEPPLGRLRFMPPKPHKGWTEVLSAKKEKKPCSQFSLSHRTYIEHGYFGVEDCLHLSVHTPNPNPINDFPIIVFTQNDEYRLSNNGTKDYSPDFFMKEEVIIVTINHRLGSLGFLSFKDDLLPGNNGLRDVILSLKWIKENIKSFGGDPSRVTLMGQHDGSGLVDILLHSPKAKGLFSAAILQSGTSWSSQYFTGKERHRAIEYSKVLEEDATTSSFLLKRLSSVEAIRLLGEDHYAVHADEARFIQRGIFAFGPTIEHEHPDAIITKLPEDDLNDIEVPIMIGYLSREVLEVLFRFLLHPQYLTFADRDFLFLFPIRSGYYFKLHSEVYDRAIKEIKDRYFDESYVKISRPGEYFSYLNDVMAMYPTDYAVRKYTNGSKADVFYYTFDYSGELNMRKKFLMKEASTIDGTWGATMGDDLCYLFICNRLRKTYRRLLADEDSEEIKVLRNMVQMWSNFAKTGNPTPKGEPIAWKPATKENKECLVINEDLELKTRVHADVITFWDNFLAKYAALAKDGVVKDTKDEL